MIGSCPPSALILMNGDTFQEMFQDRRGRVPRMLAVGYRDEQIVDELFLVALSRRPTEQGMPTVMQWKGSVGVFPGFSNSIGIQTTAAFTQ